MNDGNYHTAQAAICREVQFLLTRQPPRSLGRELWCMRKALRECPGSETLASIYERAASLKPLQQPEELKEGILRIMVAARYRMDFRSRQPEGDRSG